MTYQKFLNHIEISLEKIWAILEIHESRNDGCYDGGGIQGLNVETFDQEVVLQAHLYILNSLSEVQPYLALTKVL